MSIRATLASDGLVGNSSGYYDCLAVRMSSDPVIETLRYSQGTAEDSEERVGSCNRAFCVLGPLSSYLRGRRLTVE